MPINSLYMLDIPFEIYRKGTKKFKINYVNRNSWIIYNSIKDKSN